MCILTTRNAIVCLSNYSERYLPSLENIGAVHEYPVPRTAKDVRSFLGLATFFPGDWSQIFVEIDKSLSELIKKDGEFNWEKRHQKLFESLKGEFCSDRIFDYPDFDKSYILTTDPSKEAVGAVISQVYDLEERPITYASRHMNKSQRICSASEAEMLSLISATKISRCYL
jgi:hypothetical protein